MTNIIIILPLRVSSSVGMIITKDFVKNLSDHD